MKRCGGFESLRLFDLLTGTNNTPKIPEGRMKRTKMHAPQGNVAGCYFVKILWLWLAFIALATITPGVYGGESDLQEAALDGVPVKPGLTDPAITNYNEPHYIYINRDIVVSQNPALPADRHQLLLFIPGTHPAGTPRGGKGPFKFFQTAANSGYHVIFLTYPNDVAAAQVCNKLRNPSAFEKFRMTIIVGGTFQNRTVTRTDSIENRLLKLLLYLKNARPKEHWEQFLDKDSNIKWDAIAVAGQSQGGGHAALIAIKHRMARVICSGAPKDFNHILNRPADWYREPSETPKNRFFAINHVQDAMGQCTPAEQMENLKVLGLEKFGPPADVDTEKPPYHHARILATDYPGKKVESSTAHTTPLNPKNADVFNSVWLYMLTEPVD